MLYKERDVNRNAWSKVGEKLNFRKTCKCRHEKLSDCCTSPVGKNQRVRPSLSATEIHFLKRVSFFEMGWAVIIRRYLNRLGDTQKYIKIGNEEYLLY